MIGALTRHAALANDPLVAAHAPLLLQALPYVAHAAIRNRGPFGVADRPLRFAEVERALAEESAEAAAAKLARLLDPPADLYHSAATKRHLTCVLLRRAADRLRVAA